MTTMIENQMLEVLKARFEVNSVRHPGVSW